MLHLTVAEFGRMIECGAFDHLDRKIELIRGELFEMNPAGPLHDDLIAYLVEWSVLALVGSEMKVNSQTGLVLVDQESQPEPDLLWVKRERYQDRHPAASDVLLAVEVAYSSLNWDMNTKSALYAESGLKEYWIVDANSSTIHIFRAPVNGEYTDRSIRRRGERISPLALDSAVLNLDELFGQA